MGEIHIADVLPLPGSRPMPLEPGHDARRHISGAHARDERQPCIERSQPTKDMALEMPIPHLAVDPERLL